MDGMKPVIGFLWIVFLTVSSFSAHAGMTMSVADASQAAHQQMSDHDHSKMMEMDVDDLMDADHSGHASNCSLGHCAISCAVIISQFSFKAAETVASSDLWAGEHRLIGKTTAFEPPPPKV